MSEPAYDVAVIGGGVAGRSASIFTARHGFDTIVLDAGDSILRRNAHLENYPGFPAGINARFLLDGMEEQAVTSGATFESAVVTELSVEDGAFQVVTETGKTFNARFVIAATKNETRYLAGIDGVEIIERGKPFVASDERGRTGVDGLYVAGRLARKPHQAVVAAGHGAEVAVTLLEDAQEPFYHDWVVPEAYFTGRGRDVPPGTEEIDDATREAREQASLEWIREHVADPHPDEPVQHPDVA